MSARAPAAYESRYVLFIDILGFKNMIQGGRWSPDAIVSALRKARRTADDDGDRIRATQFSDSIIMSVPDDEFGFFSITKAAFFLIIELAQHGVLLRGGISKGPIYHQGNICFGPAVLSAYALEQEAIYPRVVLEEGLLGRAKWPDSMDNSEKHEYREKNVPLDTDGQRFVDYFHHDHDEEFDEGAVGLQIHYKKLGDLIAAHASDSDPKIRKKYDWLALKLSAARGRLEARLKKRERTIWLDK